MLWRLSRNAELSNGSELKSDKIHKLCEFGLQVEPVNVASLFQNLTGGRNQGITRDGSSQGSRKAMV